VTAPLPQPSNIKTIQYYNKARQQRVTIPTDLGPGVTWDLVLDGRPHVLATGLGWGTCELTLAQLRADAYVEAARRKVTVTTRKVDDHHLLLLARNEWHPDDPTYGDVAQRLVTWDGNEPPIQHVNPLQPPESVLPVRTMERLWWGARAMMGFPMYPSNEVRDQGLVALAAQLPDPAAAPRADVLQRVHDGLMSLPTDPAVEFITSQAPSLPQRQGSTFVRSNDSIDRLAADPFIAAAAEAVAKGDIQYLASVPCSCGADSASPPGPHAPSCQVWGH